MSNDHYIPNAHNAHLDTEDFVDELENRVLEGIGIDSVDHIDAFRTNLRKETFEAIYNCALSFSNTAPNEPPDDALVCRFLSPEKFLWLVCQKSIPFSSPRTFDDDLGKL